MTQQLTAPKGKQKTHVTKALKQLKHVTDPGVRLLDQIAYEVTRDSLLGKPKILTSR